jgi:hypothetical protein
MAVAGLGGSDVAAFVKKCKNVQNTFPDAKKTAANKAGMAVKTAWLGIAQSQAGISPANKIARRKWNVGYDVQGGMNATTLVSFRGPVHFVFGNTKQHIIGAKLLGTRNSIRNKAGKIGATSAFGGSNRGAFGKMQKKVNYNQYGSVRQQAAKGQLRTRAGKQALTIGGNLRAYAFHPGTGGKTGTWPAAKAAAIRIGPEVYSTEYKLALAKAGLGAGKSILGALK